MFSGQHAERQGSKMARSLLSIVIMVLVVFGLSRLLNTFVFGAYEIPSGSMEDTIEVGDLVFSEKLSYYANEPQKGDIITALNDKQITSTSDLASAKKNYKAGETVTLKIYRSGAYQELKVTLDEEKNTGSTSSSGSVTQQLPSVPKAST